MQSTPNDPEAPGVENIQPNTGCEPNSQNNNKSDERTEMHPSISEKELESNAGVTPSAISMKENGNSKRHNDTNNSQKKTPQQQKFISTPESQKKENQPSAVCEAGRGNPLSSNQAGARKKERMPVDEVPSSEMPSEPSESTGPVDNQQCPPNSHGGARRKNLSHQFVPHGESRNKKSQKKKRQDKENNNRVSKSDVRPNVTQPTDTGSHGQSPTVGSCMVPESNTPTNLNEYNPAFTLEEMLQLYAVIENQEGPCSQESLQGGHGTSASVVDKSDESQSPQGGIPSQSELLDLYTFTCIYTVSIQDVTKLML